MDRVLIFAQKELNKYFNLITGTCNSIRLLVTEEKKDRFYEHYVIDVENSNGTIKGCNERSILLGVYHFLRTLGCRFLYPGSDGEFIPKRDIDKISVHIDFIPAFRHRGITLEGSCSVEHVVNLIDWSIKNGFNSYFIQFRTGYTFFERWYNHSFNPYAEKEEFNDEIAERINETIRSNLYDRGMIYHAVGHGWTCEPFGIFSRGWDEYLTVPEKFQEYFALIDGKRGFYKGIPLNTNLCYSNKNVRQIVIDNVIEYLENRKDTDVLHLWLADNYNNFCECDKCAPRSPSDWYVILLNELDEKLTQSGINTKIVFLIYFELLFKPKTEKINNQERFILMFAPITRSYDKSFSNYIEEAKHKIVPSLNLNHFVPPVDCAENMRYLIDWKEMFKGDSFIFDYPLMWDGCREYGGMILAKTIYEDIHSLKQMELEGYISCQIQRIFFPSGFAMYCMGNSLYDDSLSYEELQNDYFNTAFGKNSEQVLAILKNISSWKIYDYFRGIIPLDSKDMHDAIFEYRDILKNYNDIIDKAISAANDEFILRNLDLIKILFTFVSYVLDIIEEKTGENNQQKIDDTLKDLQYWIFKVEPTCAQRFDASYFYTHVDELSKRKK